MKVLNWVLARLDEPSTWAGIGVAAAAVGVALQSGASLWVAVLAGVAAAVKSEAK
jgi:hypothetical protein